MAIIPGDLALSGFGADQVNFNVLLAGEFPRVFRTVMGSNEGADILGVELYAFGSTIPAASFGVMFTTVGVFRTSQTIAADDCPRVLAAPAGGVNPYPAGIELLWIAEWSARFDNPNAAPIAMRASTLGSKVSWRFPPGSLRAGPGQRLFAFALQPGQIDTGGVTTPQCAVQFSVMGVDYSINRRGDLAFGDKRTASLPRFAVGLDDLSP